MKHSAKIIKDSISPDGHRITTMEVVFPRIVLSEFNTHCMLARNSASSRAIPVPKMLRMVREHPYIPGSWGQNQKGMQAGAPLAGWRARSATRAWVLASRVACLFAQFLLWLGVHKQLTNRLLEPFLWHTVIVTATEWSNFFNLRNHEAAHPDIHAVAARMREAYSRSTPQQLGYGEWHLPYMEPEDLERFSSITPGALPWPETRLCSAARCARVSYLTHDGKRDVTEDVAMATDKLLPGGHMSPFEHVARPMEKEELFPATLEQARAGIISHTRKGPFCAKLKGWVALRSTIPGEEDILGWYKAEANA